MIRITTRSPRSRHLAVVPVAAAVVGLVLAGCSSDDQPTAVDTDTIPASETTSPPPEPDDDGSDDPNNDGNDPGADPGADPSPGSPAELAWGDCEDDLAPELDCATLTVPLDHDDPDGDAIDLALMRLAADDGADRAGSILFNPGGPGGSGIDILSAVAVFAQAEMELAEFDLIGFDPRGVDRSAGIRCLDDEQLDAEVFRDDGTGGDDLGPGAFDTDFAAACVERYGDTLRHFSTENTARDMDLIRAAIGDDTISYIGVSYGTYLGAIYATLFPDRVGAFVLDSAYEPTGDSIEEQYLTQLVGFEQAFDAWAADCQDDADCPFGDDDVGAAWDELRVMLARTPVPADDGRQANRSVLETATIAALYDPLSWSMLSSALADVQQGDPDGLFLLADAYVGRQPDGTFSTITQSNTVISCASGFISEEPDDPEAFVELLREAAPRFAQDVSPDDFGDDCTDLVAPVTMPDISYEGDGLFMVIGGLNDPATPMRWAEEMTEVLGPTAVLVTWAGEGHGQLLLSTCLKDLASELLNQGVLPEESTVCEPDPVVEQPQWWDVLPVPEGVGEPLPTGTLVSIGVPPSLAYGEARPTTIETDAVLDAYESALGGSGFQALGRSEDFPGVVSSTFFAPGNDLLTILVISEEALEDPEFAAVARMLDEGDALVALLHVPF